MNPNANSQEATFAQQPAEDTSNRYEASLSRIQELQSLSEFRGSGMRAGAIDLINPIEAADHVGGALNCECVSVEERVRCLFLRCLYSTRTDFLDFCL